MASAQENENKPSRAAEVNNKSDVKNGWAERSIEKHTGVKEVRRARVWEKERERKLCKWIYLLIKCEEKT